MDKILFLSHTDATGGLAAASKQALAAAVALTKSLPGATLTVGLWGGAVQPAANAVAGCGATTFFGVTGADFDVSRYASDLSAAEALVKKSGATVVIAPATSRISRALPGVAVRVGGRVETHVAALAAAGDQVHVKRWYYRQRMQATLTRTHRPWLLVVDAGVFEPWTGANGTATVEAVPVALPDNSKRTRVEGVVASAASAQTIRPDAELLFVAGAGWSKKQADGQSHAKDAEGLILDFLAKSKASLGGSKSLVDQSGEGREVLSFMTHMNQVGQTGSSPRHKKGLSTCCHGEEPHAVGWRFIGERRAVNKDPACGWARGKADVVYVADAFEVMKKVNELLAKG
jgi:electron transfer flavoprotein alpha subunit